MITVRGVLVSSSSSSLHLPSSLSLFILSPLGSLSPSTTASTPKECTTSSRIEARNSAPSCHPLVFRISARVRLNDALEDSFPADRMWVSFIEKGWAGERKGEGGSVPFSSSRGTPFLLIFSRSNSNKWNYAGGGIFERLSRIRKFPSRERPRVDKALFARLISSPDGFQ